MWHNLWKEVRGRVSKIVEYGLNNLTSDLQYATHQSPKKQKKTKKKQPHGLCVNYHPITYIFQIVEYIKFYQYLYKTADVDVQQYPLINFNQSWYIKFQTI